MNGSTHALTPDFLSNEFIPPNRQQQQQQQQQQQSPQIRQSFMPPPLSYPQQDVIGTMSDSIDMYDDHNSSIKRVGLRETALSTQIQIQQKKKARPKTGGISISGHSNIYGNGSSASSIASSSFYDGLQPPQGRFSMVSRPRSSNGSNVSVYSHNSSSSSLPYQQQHQHQQQQQQQQQHYYVPPPSQLHESPRFNQSPRLQQQQQQQQYRSNQIPLQYTQLQIQHQSQSRSIGSPGLRRTSILSQTGVGVGVGVGVGNSNVDGGDFLKTRISVDSPLSFINLSPKKQNNDRSALRTPDSMDDDDDDDDEYIDIDEGDDEDDDAVPKNTIKSIFTSNQDDELNKLKNENEVLLKELNDLKSLTIKEKQDNEDIIKSLKSENVKFRLNVNSTKQKTSNEDLETINSLKNENDNYKKLNFKLSNIENDYESVLKNYELLAEQNDKLMNQNDDLMNKLIEQQLKNKTQIEKLNESNGLIVDCFKKVILKLPEVILTKTSFEEIFKNLKIPDEINDDYNTILATKYNNNENENENKIAKITTTNNPQSGIITSDEQLFHLLRVELHTLALKLTTLEKSKLKIEKQLKKQIKNEKLTVKQLSIHRSFSEPFNSQSFNSKLRSRTNSDLSNFDYKDKDDESKFNTSFESGNGNGNRFKFGNRTGANLKFLNIVEPRFNIIRDE
ncbi:hypothetical protein CANARDRAFT_10346 [[Candida] arabinofermentans NRRL YB-2248]|uniref:Uncharacterized protein n=1 Tax=[Candida] arabinofermentans NRRL YB-2248 TaxID=983967 RepID=A0A1E4ST46_9ASCO|nr:hypothetical protein CANARDRAFT_10346 [[Candida] arabinofermentans NRRL YB-2248]